MYAAYVLKDLLGLGSRDYGVIFGRCHALLTLLDGAGNGKGICKPLFMDFQNLDLLIK
jgi:hypothetical protein